ncbi:ubiquitin carboxyl-terminal hydrolase 16 isoform X3 [Hyla sarda]|uniref:ubiquitin carboxyl-terminal hydrolase 16 isoform X3 n=1 Tax=Hyla sarda TaxID=327740 RepID=UPI0024C45009|nr:ubiquitin carboxyl-terminal hydrolase 16 isoform X3 [Hyla sarda]
MGFHYRIQQNRRLVFYFGETTCKHIQKGVKEGAVKKALVNVEWDVCQDCHMEGKEKAGSEDEEGDLVWICLKCGHRGCGRNSEKQHALKHYNTPRSEPHCLVLSVGDWNVWCYLCDDQVDYNSSGPLRQLVEYIQKKSKFRIRTSDKGEEDQVLCNNVNLPEKETPQTSEDSQKSMTKVEKTTSTLNDSKEVTVKGLSNLGNTCFFNAIMQNLSQTPALRELLNEVKNPGKTVQIQMPDAQPCREVKLEQQPGPLTLAMWQFLTEMQETKKGVVTPKELFSQVCKKAVRFRGYQQQDSQELLRYLLDGMRAEEIQRVSLALSKTLQEASDKMEEEEVKKVVKECEKKRVIPNFVDRLFGGELTSTIMCETCSTVSLVHEPFLDLSLPVLDDAPTKKNNPKVFKNIGKQKNEEEEEEDGGGYVKERNDSNTTGPSKHLQKKAKKQAKKQAKNQRQQQKLQGKTVQFSDLNANQDEEDDSVSDNNTLDNNAKPQGEPSADEVSLSEKDETEVGKPEGQSEQDGETSINNVDGKLEDLKEDMEDQKDDLGWRPKSLNDTCSSSGNPEDNEESSTETSEIKENGDLDHVTVENSEDQDENLDVLQSPRAEEDVNHLTESINQLNLSSGLGPSDIEIEIIDEAPSPQVYEVVNEDPKTAFCTLSDRKELQVDDWSVLGCLSQFTRKESLVGNNQLLCNTCTQRQAKATKNTKGVSKSLFSGDKKFVYTNAKKQMLVSVPPPILTLHLKRFQQNGFNLHKLNKHIKFPEVIDMAPFCTVKCKNIRDGAGRLPYALYGVIEHSGTMRSGHYTAYVKSRTPNPHLSELVVRGVLPEESNTEPAKGHWYHISDSHVQAVPLTKVLTSQAYLLFYERIL